jgi:Neutral/alkaline non-lysosomal ceramidase, N-terminal
MRFSLLLVLAVGCSVAPANPPTEFWAGVAVVEITPTRNVPLGGYGGRRGQPMTGVHDPIFAKALWLETPDRKVCLVTTDLIGSLLSIRDRVQPADAAVVLTASHTHSGPGALVKGFWELAMGKFDPAMVEELTGKLKKVVEDARAAKRPARIGFARGEAPGFNRNRRVKDGPVDPELHALLVVDELARPMAIVGNYTAHGTVLSEKNFLVSGDWQGAWQRAVEARFPSAVALYTNGAEGNIAPRTPGGETEWDRIESMGQALAERTANLVRTIDKTSGTARISYVERGVDLPTPTLLTAPTKSVVGLLDLNGTRMFCFPGEPIVELGLELKQRFPGSWILGLANDHLGYFLTEEAYAAGGYERNVSFYGSKMGPWLVAKLRELGERDHAQDRPGEPERGRGENHDRR